MFLCSFFRSTTNWIFKEDHGEKTVTYFYDSRFSFTKFILLPLWTVTTIPWNLCQCTNHLQFPTFFSCATCHRKIHAPIWNSVSRITALAFSTTLKLAAFLSLAHRFPGRSQRGFSLSLDLRREALLKSSPHICNLRVHFLVAVPTSPKCHL